MSSFRIFCFFSFFELFFFVLLIVTKFVHAPPPIFGTAPILVMPVLCGTETACVRPPKGNSSDPDEGEMFCEPLVASLSFCSAEKVNKVKQQYMLPLKQQNKIFRICYRSNHLLSCFIIFTLLNFLLPQIQQERLNFF